MTNQQHIDRLTEAQDLLREALDILKDVARETNNRSAEAYIIPAIEMTIDADHDWLGRHANVQEWIDELRGDDEDYEDAMQERAQTWRTETGEHWTDDAHTKYKNLHFVQWGGPGDEIWYSVENPLYDQPSFPHSKEFGQYVYSRADEGETIKALVETYMLTCQVSRELARAAINHIWNTGEF